MHYCDDTKNFSANSENAEIYVFGFLKKTSKDFLKSVDLSFKIIATKICDAGLEFDIVLLPFELVYMKNISSNAAISV